VDGVRSLRVGVRVRSAEPLLVPRGIGGRRDRSVAGISELAATRPPWFVAVLWATFAMKAVAGLLALALVRPWGRFVPRPLLLGGAWVAGANNLSEIR